MYLYIYDSCLNDKKYKNLINKIENKIIDLDIKGKELHLNLLKNVSDFIDREIKQDAHTVVIIGDDNTFSQALNSIVSKNIVVGFIPTDSKSVFAKTFGIPYGDLACDVLSGRIIKKIDIGKINQKYFLHSVQIENANDVILKIDNFEIKVAPNNKIIIKNFDQENLLGDHVSNPTDGILEMYIEKPGKLFTKTSQHSLFATKEVNITSKNDSVSLLLDNYQRINTPAKISVIKEKLQIIVGSNRQF